MQPPLDSRRVLGSLTVTLGLVLLTFAGPDARAEEAGSSISITPRYYQTMLEASDFSEIFSIPVMGLTITVSPWQSWDFTLNGLRGEGDADFTPLATSPFSGFGGPGDVEAKRTDLEFVARYRFPSKPFFAMGGFRRISFEERFELDQNSFFYNAGLVEKDEIEISVFELGGGFAAPVSEDARHSVFANAILGLGRFRSESKDFEIGNFTDIDDRGFAGLIDFNFGYQYALQANTALSLRYRLIGVHRDATIDDETLVHGLEIAVLRRF